VLVERHQLGRDDVLERHHEQRHRAHVHALRAPHDRVVDADAERVVDQVDQHLPVPRLQQPPLGGPLRAQPFRLEHLERALGVLGPHHQVEVVGRLRTPARPRSEAAAEQEGDLGPVQRGCRLPQRAGDLVEGDCGL
jgi:hypothetical protein